MANKYTDAVFHAKLPGVTKAVLGALAWRANAHGTCYPGYTRIAADAGFSYDTVKRAIKCLVNQGVISVIGHRPIHDGAAKSTHVYQIHLERLNALSTQSNVGSRTLGGEHGVFSAPSDWGRRAHELGADSPANTSVKPSHKTLNDDYEYGSSEKAETSNRENPDFEELATCLEDILNLSGKRSDLLRLKHPIPFLIQAATWASTHPYWGPGGKGNLTGKSFVDFVRACLKENALLDQFEKAKKNGRVKALAGAPESTENLAQARERAKRRATCFHRQDCSLLPGCDCWCHAEEVEAESRTFEIEDD